MKSKNKIEIDILKKVFPFDEIEFEKSEQPDFILKYKTGNIIGAEVTELYFDETSARLKNVDGYVSNLINNKKFLHKDDKKKLNVDEITYFQKDNLDKPIKMNALFLPKYTLSSYHKAIHSRIKDKNDKIRKYDKNVQQCNLVICDRENKLEKVQLKDFNKNFFSKELIDEINSSTFDEIYFITRVGSKDYFIQLKASILIDLAYSLWDYLRCNDLIGKLMYLEMDFEDLLGETLLRSGYEKVRYVMYEDTKIVYCGRYGVGLQFHDNGEWGFGIYDTYPLRMKDDYGQFYTLEKKKKFFNEQKFNSFKKSYEKKIVSGMIGFSVLE